MVSSPPYLPGTWPGHCEVGDAGSVRQALGDRRQPAVLDLARRRTAPPDRPAPRRRRATAPQQKRRARRAGEGRACASCRAPAPRSAARTKWPSPTSISPGRSVSFDGEGRRPGGRLRGLAFHQLVESEAVVGIGLRHRGQQRLGIGMQRDCGTARREGASSTMRPAHITTIRSAM